MANALLLGGSDGSAPNLNTVALEYVGDGVLAELGSHLFARGALASITTLNISNTDFDEESMTGLVNGFRQSGHAGSTLQTLMFAACNVGYEKDEAIVDGAAKGSSLALIAGLRDTIVPNLKNLWVPYGALLVLEVPELVDVLKGRAPCARTLRTVVLSERFLRPADLETLQAGLQQATVTLD